MKIQSGTAKAGHNDPDWELHKGHGPTLYKQFEIAFSMALVVIMLSGLYLGLASKGLKTRTIQLSLSGTALFLILALLA